MVLLLALPRSASATYTSTSSMTFGQCESYCAGLGLMVACVTTDEEETELEGMLSGSCSEFWVASEARRATRGPRARRATGPKSARRPPGRLVAPKGQVVLRVDFHRPAPFVDRRRQPLPRQALDHKAGLTLALDIQPQKRLGIRAS